MRFHRTRSRTLGEHEHSCSPKCGYIAQSSRSIDDRFRSKIGPTNENGCILWIGATTDKGYGTLRHSREMPVALKAHRIAWELAYGKIPPGLSVLHECDNPPCVNPSHLFLGTIIDNMTDKVAKGRQARGERTGGSKLKASDVKKIRKRYAAGGVLQSTLAKRFNVSQPIISRIVRRHGWKHI